MTKIYLLLNQVGFSSLEENLSDFEVMVSDGSLDEIVTQILNFSPEIVIVDNSFENADFAVRQIKTATKSNNTQVILLLNNEIETTCLDLVDGIVVQPIEKSVLVSTINSHLKIKNSLDRLYENNKELSRSLYQLNVLYNTSSQFAGTLNTNKLYDIMTEAMEKTLSFDVACVFIFDSEGKPQININSIHAPSQNLINALKIRSILSFRTVLDETKIPDDKDFVDIKVVQKTKQSRSNHVYGLEVLSTDSLFAPIKVGDEFFGVIELFREAPFLPEDVTCFQAITHQVALPLRSAKLYEDISITNKKLEKLEKLKSDFVSIVSHELRTPLTPINNSLEIILAGQAGEITSDTQNFLSMIKRNIQRLSEIIEDLLDLSRIQTGKLDLKYKMVDIAPSLELLQKTFQQVANDKNISLNLDIEKNLPEIYADRRRLEQIFSNLVSNALKFTQENGKIDIVARVVQDNEIDFSRLIMPKIKLDNSYIKISVKDTGVGIKEEDIPRIFDKFSQIESSLNRNKGGVGLGLTISKQLLDSHLGAVWVDSKENEGSTFNIILPLVSEKNKFIMNLSKTLINNPQTGLIALKFNKGSNIIDELKAKKLLNLTKLSSELFLKEGDFSQYFIYIPKITKSSFEAMYLSLQDYLKSNLYDIMLSSKYCDNDNSDGFEIFENLSSRFSKLEEK